MYPELNFDYYPIVFSKIMFLFNFRFSKIPVIAKEEGDEPTGRDESKRFP